MKSLKVDFCIIIVLVIFMGLSRIIETDDCVIMFCKFESSGVKILCLQFQELFCL